MSHTSRDIDGQGYSGPLIPERRDLHFLPPAQRIGDWHKEGPNVTQCMNAMLLLFPAGERMFIVAVRGYRDEIPDPDLIEGGDRLHRPADHAQPRAHRIKRDHGKRRPAGPPARPLRPGPCSTGSSRTRGARRRWRPPSHWSTTPRSWATCCCASPR